MQSSWKQSDSNSPRAPDAEHLDSGVADERELPFEYSRILVEETVGRHPVASFYKELFSVDAKVQSLIV